MEEILNTQKTEVQFNNKKLNTATNNILKYTDGIKKNLLLIAVELKRIKEDELYVEDGYTSVSDYASKVLGYSRANTSKLVNVAERFVEKQQKNTIFLTEDGKDFTVGQLTEMLALPKEEIVEMVKDGELTPNMTAKAIREQVKAHKEVDNEIAAENEEVDVEVEVDGEKVESTVEENKLVDEEYGSSLLKSMTSYLLELTKLMKDGVNNGENILDKIDELEDEVKTILSFIDEL